MFWSITATGAAEVLQRCRRGAAEVPQRCPRGAAEVPQRCPMQRCSEMHKQEQGSDSTYSDSIPSNNLQQIIASAKVIRGSHPVPRLNVAGKVDAKR